jgi:hypothetical protein
MPPINKKVATLTLMVALSAFADAKSADSKSQEWFGIAPPSGLSSPHKPVVVTKGAALNPIQFPADETRYPELQGQRIYKDVATIVDFSKQSYSHGDKVWGRVTGFPAAKSTIEWVAKQFSELHLTAVAVQEYDAATNTPMWWSNSWQVTLLADPAFGAQSKDVVLASAVPTSGSQFPNGGLSADLVYVGATTDEKLPDIDVRGKVAVQHLRPLAGAFSERTHTVERAQELTKRGAVAILNVIQQTGNMHVRDFGNCGSPCFNLGTADGAFVESVIEHAKKLNPAIPVRVALKLTADRLTGLKGHNAVGIIPGKSDENIIVNAHADGWYDAAGDNADGLAVVVALARHFSLAKNKPERTLVFVASGGHHSTGLNGPANFVRMNPALTAKTVLVLNLEHIAQMQIKSDSWTVGTTEQPMNFGVDNSAPAIYAIAKRGVERYGFNLNPAFGTSVAGDLGGYAPLGVARVQAIHSGPMYHTSGDVPETISIPGLERAAHFYAYLVDEFTKTARGELNPVKQ